MDIHALRGDYYACFMLIYYVTEYIESLILGIVEPCATSRKELEARERIFQGFSCNLSSCSHLHQVFISSYSFLYYNIVLAKAANAHILLILLRGLVCILIKLAMDFFHEFYV